MTESPLNLVNVNRASLEELVAIRGIGPGLAQGIIDDRPYTDINDLVRVPGINQIKLLSLMPFITIGEKKTKKAAPKAIPQPETQHAEPVSKLGHTETFVFLEDRNERQDAILIILGGFVFGLILLMLRRSSR
ncbi:MAG: helix-hairpin-helix domain-containing protein [Brevefilum sp.]|nr:helix-hairpin-helix domain-containing protein [Brevefilum sp.]